MWRLNEGDRERMGGALPHLVIGSEMPCHAFTEKMLLLARGERITTAVQLERLLRPDVVFADDVPPALAAVVAERQRALGIATRESGKAAATPVSVPEARAEAEFWMPPAWTAGPIKRAARVPFAAEITEAYTIHREALRRLRELGEQVRAGGNLDLTPVYGTVEEVVASLQRNEQAFATLLWLKSRDDSLHKHMLNSCVLAAMVAESAGLDEQARALSLGALMHDIGKACLPAAVLRQSGELGEAEEELLERHTTIGLEIGGRLGLPAAAMEAIGEHHERFDGCGYPEGQRGEAISVAGRVMAVVNAYDNLVGERPGRPAWPANEAMRQLAKQAGSAFDPAAVGSLVRVIGLVPVGSTVRLSTGEQAVVVTVNQEAISRPTVLVTATSENATVVQPYLLDLSEPAGREIVSMENPRTAGVDLDRYLAMVPELLGKPRRAIFGMA